MSAKDDDPWKDLVVDKPPRASLQPRGSCSTETSAKGRARSYSTPRDPKDVLGWGARAVLKTRRLASLPPVLEETEADYRWSSGQPQQGDGLEGELRDSPWEMYNHNSKKNIDFHGRGKVSMLEVAAYTQSRRQLESRG